MCGPANTPLLKPMCRWQVMTAFVSKESVTSGSVEVWPEKLNSRQGLDRGNLVYRKSQKVLTKL